MVVGCGQSACFPTSWCIFEWKRYKKENADLQHDTWPKMDWTLESQFRTMLYLGVIGLHRTNSTLPQQPRVKGFDPPWNFLVTWKKDSFSLSQQKGIARKPAISLDPIYDLTFIINTSFTRLTCSFVVRPATTRTIWKQANPITGRKNSPDRLMMDKLSQWCQGATHATDELIQMVLTQLTTTEGTDHWGKYTVVHMRSKDDWTCYSMHRMWGHFILKICLQEMVDMVDFTM